MQIPTETDLLLATARADAAALDHDRIRTLAASTNWTLLVAAAERHKLTPIVHRSLQLHAADLVPADALRHLSVRRMTTVSRNQRFADELVRLNGLLLARGLEVIAYKGPSAATVLYGDLRLRTFGDMDFLVKRDDLDAVCDLLQENGYRNRWTGTAEQKKLKEREQKEHCFVSGPITLEPHWSITARRFPFDIDYPSLWSRARQVPFNGSQVLTFGPEDMLLVLCVCGGKGHWQRIQMISDVAEAIRASPALDWRDCFDRAESSRSARMFKVGLYLAHTLLDAKLPDHVIQRIGEDRQVPAIADKITRLLSTPSKRNAWTRQGAAMFSPLLFSLRDNAHDKLEYLVRTTTTPRSQHLRRFPLGNSMSWAYRLIVPIHDYVLMPVWYLLRPGARKPPDEFQQD
ncbi:MAG TPA: nucleotidyltransferase family protein [Gammaproteobacteria bacterium]|nr:nucleotidyltransferase family protein [Gammaproteobacteria bacterium]